MNSTTIRACATCTSYDASEGECLNFGTMPPDARCDDHLTAEEEASPEYQAALNTARKALQGSIRREKRRAQAVRLGLRVIAGGK